MWPYTARAEFVVEGGYVPTTSLKKILEMSARGRKYRFVGGGTDAAKTSSILQILLDMGGVFKNDRIDIVGKSIPHVRDGAWKDTAQILVAQNYAPYVKTLHTPDLHLVMPTKSELHYISFDNIEKAHGPRRRVLFLNEANYIPWPIAQQLMGRADIVYADWNPTFPFWAYDEIMENPKYADAWDFVQLTYRDNESLNPERIQDLERRRGDAAYARVYLDGLLGQIEGQVYTGWRWINEIPFAAKLIYRGLDLGFTNDPTAIVAVYAYEGGYLLDEELYETGIQDEDLANYIGTLPHPEIPIIMSAEAPKSIMHLRRYGEPFGLKARPVPNYAGKKPDMVNWVRGVPIYATTRSQNLRWEQERYMWYQDRLSGKFTNELTDGDDHALDGVIHGLSPFMSDIFQRAPKRKKAIDTWDFSKQYGAVL